MEKTLSKICGLLGEKDAELQCAAARVLGAVGATEREVLEALLGALATDNQAVRVYVLDAIAKIGKPQAVPAILPLLNAPDAVRRKALAALAACGPEAAPRIAAGWKGADKDRKLGIIDALGAIGSKEAIEQLYECLLDADLDVVKHACFTIKGRIDQMPTKDRGAVLSRTLKFLKSGPVKKETQPTVSGIKLLGATRSAEAKAPLVEYLDPERPPIVRIHALEALAYLDLGGTADGKLAERLLPLLDDQNPGVVSNAVNVLSRLALPGGVAPKLVKLVGHRDQGVRVFALRALGKVGTSAAADAILPCLGDGDFRVREAAGQALRGNAEFAGALADALDKTSDRELARTLGGLLREHGKAISDAAAQRFARRAIEGIGAGEEKCAAYVEILRVVRPELLREALLAEGRKRKKKDELEEAERYFSVLERDGLFTAETRYELAVVRLARRPKEAAAPETDATGPVALLSAVLRSGDFPLVKTIKGEKGLEAGAFLYLGFQFAERVGPQDRDFAAEMLKHVLKKFSRSPEAKVAKMKMKTEWKEL